MAEKCSLCEKREQIELDNGEQMYLDEDNILWLEDPNNLSNMWYLGLDYCFLCGRNLVDNA